MTQTDRVVTRTAHAKINLTLHVTGQRTDGYHLLDSLVMFTQLGDEVSVRPAENLSLSIDGPFATGLTTGDDNLVLKAARTFGVDRGAAITLTKTLPVASGIGGGSADAAATLLALAELWDVPLPDAETILSLGADVPVCMANDLTRMRGIGEDLERLGQAPMMDVLLVNPGVGVSTATVFNALPSKTNPAMAGPMPDPFDADNWTEWLCAQRNDLQVPAVNSVPAIGDVLAALARQDGCLLTRMSGSGATCFAVFEDLAACEAAAATLRAHHPDWWIAETAEAAI